MSAIDSFHSLIRSWPSDNEFAADHDVTRALVRCWKHRNSIPVAYWQRTIEAADQRGLRGVTLDLLARLKMARGAQQRETRDGQQVCTERQSLNAG